AKAERPKKSLYMEELFTPAPHQHLKHEKHSKAYRPVSLTHFTEVILYKELCRFYDTAVLRI
ncbi:MAG: hypothetical protein P8L18_15960, partial [Verrucomicrobiota bacterium]|nr:hypothetical protein [Verrucomicrobiota bacterium]